MKMGQKNSGPGTTGRSDANGANQSQNTSLPKPTRRVNRSVAEAQKTLLGQALRIALDGR